MSVELEFWIPIVSGIPDSLSCIPDSKAQDSRFHQQKFPDSEILIRIHGVISVFFHYCLFCFASRSLVLLRPARQNRHATQARVVFAVYTKLISHDGSPLSRVPISGIVTPRKHFLLDCEQSLFFAKLLHAKPNHASGEAACREKRGRKPEKKK